jgi:hypothetical protein
MIPVADPSAPNQVVVKYWQLSLCELATFGACNQNIVPQSYIIEMNANQESCDAGFNNATHDGAEWALKYGGMNKVYYGSYNVLYDRIANVTLVCDPAATTPVASTPAVKTTPDGYKQQFDLRINTSVACNTPAPTPPPVNADIVVTRFTQPNCGGAMTNVTFPRGVCARDGLTSTVRYCSAGVLHVLYFNGSISCSGAPESAGVLSVGQCYQEPIDGTSFIVTECNDQN